MNEELIQYEDHIFSRVSDNYFKINKTIADTQNMLDDLKDIAKEKDNIIASLENDKQSLILENSTLMSENKKQYDLITNYEKDAAFWEKVKINSVRLADLISEKETELKWLQEQKEEFKKDKAKILSDNEKLKSDLNAKTKELSDKQNELDIYVKKHRENENGQRLEIERLENVNSSLAKELKGTKTRVKELEKDNNTAKNKIETLSKETKDLMNQINNLESRLNINEDDTTISNISDLEKYVSENADLKKQIEDLNKDIKWLVGYAKGTDRKIMSYFNNNKTELQEHNNWLNNKPKDNAYLRFFESNSEVNLENTKCPESLPKRVKGLA